VVFVEKLFVCGDLDGNCLVVRVHQIGVALLGLLLSCWWEYLHSFAGRNWCAALFRLSSSIRDVIFGLFVAGGNSLFFANSFGAYMLWIIRFSSEFMSSIVGSIYLVLDLFLLLSEGLHFP